MNERKKKILIRNIIVGIVVLILTTFIVKNYMVRVKDVLENGRKTSKTFKPLPKKHIQDVEPKKIAKEPVKEVQEEPTRSPSSIRSFPHFEAHSWQYKTISRLKKNLSDDYDVTFKEEKTLQLKRRGKNHTVKQVVVSISAPKRGTSTYRALIDQKTGAILRTWDRPIFEDITRQHVVQLKVKE